MADFLNYSSEMEKLIFVYVKYIICLNFQGGGGGGAVRLVKLSLD